MTDTPTERAYESAWARLRHHKVVQWTLAYAAAGYTLLHAVEMVSGALGWPHAVIRITTLLLLLGLPVTTTVAWYHGHRAQHRVSGPELMILTILLTIAGSVLWFFGRPGHDPDVAQVAGSHAEPTGAPPSPTLAPPEKSIAVLPFTDMSPAKDQEYMADGLAEELLNLLAQIPELRVISRSSAFSYKRKDAKLSQIAKELSVAHILEGSVRTDGNKIRVTAQLIEARTDTHLWSATYDRPLDDIFAVQDEIAGAVVAQLKIKLLGAAPKAKAADPEAYALFLQARALYRQHTPEGFEQAIALAQQALARDPTLAAAWALLSSAYSSVERYGLARAAADKALALDPGYARAHVSLGSIAMVYDGDLAQAARHLEQALALAPGDTVVLGSAAELALSLGRLAQATAIEEYVVARDPVNPANHFHVGFCYHLAQRPEAALASLRRALQLAPGYIAAQYQIGLALLAQGQREAALAEMLKEPSETWRLQGLTTVYHALGRQAESDAALAELIAKYAGDSAFNIAYVLADRGEADRAFEWLDKAVANKDPGLAEIVTEPLFAKIHDDPRWLPFLRRIGKAPEQLAAIPFEVTLPR